MNMTNSLHIIKMLFLYASIFTSFPLIAQWNNGIIISPGLMFAAERDFGFSPLWYDGAGPLIKVAYSADRERRSDLVEAQFSTATLKNRYNTEMTVYNISLNAFMFFHRNKNRNAGLHWGFANRNATNVRDNEVIVNFNYRFDYFTAFGPAMRYRKSFQLFKKDFSFETIADVQVLGFILQSSYVHSAPKGYETNASGAWEIFTSSVEGFYPGAAWHVSVSPALSYFFKSGNTLILQYRYEYLKLSSAHISQKSRGFLTLGLNVGL